jgi:hypothetical protein
VEIVAALAYTAVIALFPVAVYYSAGRRIQRRYATAAPSDRRAALRVAGMALVVWYVGAVPASYEFSSYGEWPKALLYPLGIAVFVALMAVFGWAQSRAFDSTMQKFAALPRRVRIAGSALAATLATAIFVRYMWAQGDTEWPIPTLILAAVLVFMVYAFTKTGDR